MQPAGHELHSRTFVVAMALFGALCLVAAVILGLLAAYAFATRNDPFYDSPGIAAAIILGPVAVFYGVVGLLCLRASLGAVAARRQTTLRPRTGEEPVRQAQIVVALVWLAFLLLAVAVVVRAT